MPSKKANAKGKAKVPKPAPPEKKEVDIRPFLVSEFLLDRVYLASISLLSISQVQLFQRPGGERDLFRCLKIAVLKGNQRFKCLFKCA